MGKTEAELVLSSPRRTRLGLAPNLAAGTGPGSKKTQPRNKQPNNGPHVINLDYYHVTVASLL